MSIILTLDDFDPNKKEQRMQLKKKYNITLLNIFPLVIENIIHDYVHDIIEVMICMNETRSYKISINSQYINCNQISFTYEYFKVNKITSSLVGDFAISNNIAVITQPVTKFYMYVLIINKYMKTLYHHNEYFSSTNIINAFYGIDSHFITTYNNNVLTCQYVNHMVLCMQIINHKLFKNMIVIIKCINKKIDACNI